jgi:hypothetical protein
MSRLFLSRNIETQRTHAGELGEGAPELVPEELSAAHNSWVAIHALPATSRDPGQPHRTAALLELSLASFGGLTPAASGGGGGAASEGAVELLPAGLAAHCLPLLQSIADGRSRRYPLAAVLDLCTQVLRRAPPVFSLAPAHPVRPSGAKGEKEQEERQRRAHTLCLHTLQNLLRCPALSAAELTEVATAVADWAEQQLQPTPAALGLAPLSLLLTPAGGPGGPATMLHTVVNGQTVVQFINRWLKQIVDDCLRPALAALRARATRALNARKDAGAIIELIGRLLARRGRAVELACALATQYALIWPAELGSYNAERWLAAAADSISLARECGGGAEGSSQPPPPPPPQQQLEALFVADAAAVVRARLLPDCAVLGVGAARELLALRLLSGGGGDASGGGGGSAAVVAQWRLLSGGGGDASGGGSDGHCHQRQRRRRGGGFVLDAASTRALDLYRKLSWGGLPEGLRLEALAPLELLVEQLHGADGATWDLCTGLVSADGRRALALEGAVLALLRTVKDASTPALASRAFDLYCRVLVLPKDGQRTQLPRDQPPMAHRPKPFLDCVKRLPRDVRASLLARNDGAMIQGVVSTLVATLAEQAAVAGQRSQAEREAIATIQGLPAGLLGPLVRAALLPGGELNGALSAASREQLHRCADLSEPAMRRMLYKATDASAPAARQAALETLLSCALRSQQPEVLAATLGYIAKRIQNEAVERRLATLELLMRHQAEVLRMVLGAGRLRRRQQQSSAPSAMMEMDSGGEDEALLTAPWLQLLEDFLSAPDSAEVGRQHLHSWSAFAQKMLSQALAGCLVVDTTASPPPPGGGGGNGQQRVVRLGGIQRAWAELAVEISWRVAVFSSGPAKAATSWQIDASSLVPVTATLGKSWLHRVKAAATGAGVSVEEVETAVRTEVRTLVNFLHDLYTARTQHGEPATTGEQMQEEEQMQSEGGYVEAGEFSQRALTREVEHFAPLFKLAGRFYPCVPLLQHKLEEVAGLVTIRPWEDRNPVEGVPGSLVNPAVISKLDTTARAAERQVESLLSVVMTQHTKATPWQGVACIVAYVDAQLRRHGTGNAHLGGEKLLTRWLSIHLPARRRRSSSAAAGGAVVVRVHGTTVKISTAAAGRGGSGGGDGGGGSMSMSRAARQQKRARAVAALLQMCPSAVHLKLVHRFLAVHRQDVLQPFLDPADAVTGIFYQPKTSSSRRSRGVSSWADEDMDHYWDGCGEDGYAGGGNMSEDEEQEAEPLLLPLSYGLRRLLQPQAATLAARWRARACDQELSATERAQAVARFCSSPATDFSQIVETIDVMWRRQQEQLTAAKEAAGRMSAAVDATRAAELTDDRAARAEALAATKAARQDKAAAEKSAKVVLPLAVSEALLEGTMRGDEPKAPFSFLLSPQLLARTEARVTMAVIERAVALIPPSEVARFASALLGNREVRRSMKVSVHKALLRLLRHSTQEGPLLVLREWKRSELHRDVRVVILQCALELLHAGGATTSDDVWTVLESAARDPSLDPMVKVVLLAPDSLARPRDAMLDGLPSNLSVSKLATQLRTCGLGGGVGGGDSQSHLAPACEARYFRGVLCALDGAEAEVATAQDAAAAVAEEALAAAKAMPAAASAARKKAVARAAKELQAARARACGARDLQALFLAALPGWVVEHGPDGKPDSVWRQRLSGGGSRGGYTSAEAEEVCRLAAQRTPEICARLRSTVLCEDPAWVAVDSGDAGARNTAVLGRAPHLLVRFCLQAQRSSLSPSSPSSAGSGGGEAAVGGGGGVLAEVIQQLAQRILQVPLSERSLRSAVFSRLTALHDCILGEDGSGGGGGSSHGRSELLLGQAAELLREALAPMLWLQEEASQMAQLARKRLPSAHEAGSGQGGKRQRGPQAAGGW